MANLQHLMSITYLYPPKIAISKTISRPEMGDKMYALKTFTQKMDKMLETFFATAAVITASPRLLG